MPQTTQTYHLNTRHQLVDLNKEFVNFKLDFNVVSKDNKEFEVIVLEQPQLDSNLNMQTLQMKKAVGKIGGSIVADKNVYQNYFLVLKAPDGATEAVDVDLTINLEEIVPHETFIPPDTTAVTAVATAAVTPFYRENWFYLLVIAAILIGLYYYLRSRSQKAEAATVTAVIESAPAPAPAPPAAIEQAPAPAVETPELLSPSVPATTNSLYSRLKSIT
jgi:hypothetical protein